MNTKWLKEIQKDPESFKRDPKRDPKRCLKWDDLIEIALRFAHCAWLPASIWNNLLHSIQTTLVLLAGCFPIFYRLLLGVPFMMLKIELILISDLIHRTYSSSNTSFRWSFEPIMLAYWMPTFENLRLRFFSRNSPIKTSTTTPSNGLQWLSVIYSLQLCNIFFFQKTFLESNKSGELPELIRIRRFNSAR